MSDRSTTERVAVWLAALICLIFLASLQHVRMRRVAPPPPSPVAIGQMERDARVDVLVKAVERLPRVGPEPHVEDGAWVPANQASVRVLWENQGAYHPVGSCQTNAEGRCRVEALPRGILWILAEAPGRARSGTRLVLDAKERPAVLHLVPAHTLRVTVRDEEGRGLREATVMATTDDPLPYGALTDVEGGVSLNRLGAPPYTVKASARGYESVTERAEGDSLTLRLRRLASLLVEVSLEDGEPAGKANLALGGPSLWPPRTLVTDPLGRAEIHGLLAGTFDVRATLGERLSRTQTGVVLGRGEERRIALTLLAARQIEVAVTDGETPDAASVPNAEVVIAEDGISAFPLRGRTDATGRLRLGPVEPGPAVVSASAEGFVGSMSLPIPEPCDEVVKVPLLRGGTIAGRVVDQYGHAIAGASIEIIGSDPSGMPILDSPQGRASRSAHFAWALGFPGELLPVGELGVMTGPIAPITQALPLEFLVPPGPETTTSIGPGLGPAGGSEAWVSGVDGGFVANPVTPGRVAALARHPEYVEGRSDLVSLVSGGRVEVTIVLVGGGFLEGRVVDPWDRPVAGARVEVTGQKSTLRRVTVSAGDGAFAFAALPSEVWVAVSRPERPEQAVVRQRVSIRPEGRESVTIELPEPRESVTVLVVDERDNPMDAVEVSVGSLVVGTPLGRTRFTDAEGKATFDDSRGLALSVRAEVTGYLVATTSTESAPERLRLVLQRGVSLAGRITSVRGRRVVPGARITVAGSHRSQMAVSDADGRFRMSDVAPGRVELTVEGPGLATLHTERRVERTGRDDRPFELFDIDLAEGGQASGQIVDAEGVPVPGARVSPNRVESYVPLGTPPAGTATTDRQGRFSLTGLSEGTVVLEAVGAGIGRGRSEPIRILVGREVTDVRIVLATRDGDTENYAGAANLAVSLTERDGHIIIAAVAAGSTAERGGARGGDTVVSIDAIPPASIDEARQRLGGQQNSEVVLELLRSGQTLRVRVAREAVR